MKKILQNERLIFNLIAINILIIYLHSFNTFKPYFFYFDLVDVGLTLFFSIEIGYSIFVKHPSFSSYFKNNWNKLDFISILLSLPSILVIFIPNFEILTGFIALRSLRIFKTLRIIEYIPNGKKISKKLFKAFKGITFILFTFLVFTTVISLISVSLFKSVAPNYFQNAFDSFYTIFKIFSGDGFSDVVAEIQQNTSPLLTGFSKLYFVIIVFSGSILGLSLINSVFINEMSTIADDVVENDKSIDALHKQLEIVKNQQTEILKKLEELSTNNKP
ncbi:ion transporter [Flavobacterium aciduliphilum]|uniref:Voltage-gated sodium channel n=1 Tax=Flavobacterium aciduliphilum TaxID=1101402 RepID=A0A328YK74_9FLAO|nr:ion transporter [Flavobacterium aciduliphilum]RAR72462.1 voltage-gated sodium channel [Flavobacterium aciduliphilum]